MGENIEVKGLPIEVRGDYANVLILDEWQLMNEDAWEFVGVPMLLDDNSDAVFIYKGEDVIKWRSNE